MSAPVNVLAVMGRAIEAMNDAPQIPAFMSGELEEASAAVAELIEAAKAFDKTYAWHWDRVDGAAVIMPERVPEFEDRAERLTKALARVRGAA